MGRVHNTTLDRRLGARWARWTTRRRAPILWSALLAAIVAAPIAERLRDLQAQLDAAKMGAAHPAPLVSKDGRLQIVIVRTRFPAGEVSRNAPIIAAVESAVDEARRTGGPGVRIGVTGDVVTTAAE